MAQKHRGFPALGCAQGQSRTVYTRIFSPLLYQLSYLGLLCNYSMLQAMFNQTPIAW
jgi:hypothetical protein